MPDPALGSLLALSAALATRDAYRVVVPFSPAAAAAPAGEVEEALLQAHLFVGFPDVLAALAAWRRISGTPAPPDGGEGADDWRVRGESVCATVYGSNYLRLRENVRALHPDLERWMIEGGYGRVIGRPGLSLRARELCNVALLGAWGAPRQLHSHLRGALHAGAAPAEVDAAVAAACGVLDDGAASEVRALWDGVRGARVNPEEGESGVPGLR
jgi:4-carboxymuconolactone decarboxylase